MEESDIDITKGYFIRHNGEVVFINKNHIVSTGNVEHNLCLGLQGIKELVVPDGIHHVFVDYNDLESITIPDSVIGLYIDYNNLKSLKLPKNLMFLNLRCNKYDLELELPESIWTCRISENIKLKNGVKEFENNNNNKLLEIYFDY